MVTSSTSSPGTDEATRWRMEAAALRPTVALARIITEAVGFWSALRKLPRSGITMWTRAAAIPEICWMVRPISPSRARTRVTSCMKEVRPSEPTLSKSS
ncbi:hypothetical protein D3C87_1455710 [compost metagenome]